MTSCSWCGDKIPEYEERFYSESDPKGKYPCCSQECLNSLEEDDSINEREQHSLMLRWRYAA